MIRQLIREMLLCERAITPEQLPTGTQVVINSTIIGKGGWKVSIFYPSARTSSQGQDQQLDTIHLDIASGEIKISKPLGMGNCLGSYEVSSVYANVQGLGPMLYDIALELAGADGLMSDRRMVSAQAWNVWNYFLNNRPDVTSKQLDSLPGTLTPQNNKDDCNQTSSKLDGEKDLMDLFFNKEKENDKWSKSPLSKVYYKLGGTPVLDKLKSLHKLQHKKIKGKLKIVDNN